MNIPKSNLKRLVLALGSNLGNRIKNINNAIIFLEESLSLKNIKKSSIIENRAMLLPNSTKDWDIAFLNIVISADIDINNFEPIDILYIIKDIEVKLGRKKSQKWSPREIDIDILAIDDYMIKIDQILNIPHFGIYDRDFFQNGFLEIEPNLYHKIINKS